MELLFSGQFNRDIDGRSRKLSSEIRNAIFDVKKAKDSSQIQYLVKLKKYKVHYRSLQ